MQVLGECPYGYVVNSGSGNVTDIFQRNAAGSLQSGASVDESHGVEQCRRGEIIQQQDIRSGRQRLGDLTLIFHLHLDRQSWAGLAGGMHGTFDGTCGGNVIFLYQDPVIQAYAVVVAAADAYSILLRVAKAGYGLAGIQHRDSQPGYRLGVPACEGGRSRKGLQKIQRGSFTGEDMTRRSMERTEDLTGSYGGGFLAFGVMAGAFQAGLKVGREPDCNLRVAGHDNHPLSAFTCPPLTTVSQNYGEIGRRALDLLFERIGVTDGRDGETPADGCILLNAELVLRKSA